MRIFLLLLFVFSCSLLFGQRRLNLTNYVMIWNDEFSYTDTSQLFNGANAKWIRGNSYNDPRGTENNLTTRTTNEILGNNYISVANGVLTLSDRFNGDSRYFADSVYYDGVWWRSNRNSAFLTARNPVDDYPCSLGGGNWVGGMAYGIFEARVKLPNKNTDYPAWWLWNDPYQPCTNGSSEFSCQRTHPTRPCPTQGFCPGFEIDVFEAKYVQEPWQSAPEQRFWATVQANGYQSDPECFPCATNYKFDNSNPQNTWHTYTLAWTPDSVTWFIDGNEIRTQKTGVPRAKLHMFLSMSSYNGDSINLGKLQFDYVRIYRPIGVNYTPRYNSQRGANVIWDNPDTSNSVGFGNYYNSYRQNSYFGDNYQFESAGFNSDTRRDILQGSTYVIGGESRLAYILTGRPSQVPNLPLIPDNNIYSSQVFPYLPNYAHTVIRDTLATNADASSNMAVFNDLVNNKYTIFYKGTNKRLWTVSFNNAGQRIVQQLAPSTISWADVGNSLLYVPQNAMHQQRVYYRTDKNQLRYFEWCPTSNS
jgi:Glycosyl hydrolases family 16